MAWYYLYREWCIYLWLLKQQWLSISRYDAFNDQCKYLKYRKCFSMWIKFTIRMEYYGLRFIRHVYLPYNKCEWLWFSSDVGVNCKCCNKQHNKYIKVLQYDAILLEWRSIFNHGHVRTYDTKCCGLRFSSDVSVDCKYSNTSNANGDNANIGRQYLR